MIPVITETMVMRAPKPAANMIRANPPNEIEAKY